MLRAPAGLLKTRFFLERWETSLLLLSYKFRTIIGSYSVLRIIEWVSSSVNTFFDFAQFWSLTIKKATLSSSSSATQPMANGILVICKGLGNRRTFHSVYLLQLAQLAPLPSTLYICSFYNQHEKSIAHLLGICLAKSTACCINCSTACLLKHTFNVHRTQSTAV